MSLQPYHNPTLLPENLASLITAISIAARLSIRCSSLLLEALLETAKYSTSFGLGFSRQTLISAVSSAKRLHMLTTGATEGTVLDAARYVFCPKGNHGMLSVGQNGIMSAVRAETIVHPFSIVVNCKSSPLTASCSPHSSQRRISASSRSIHKSWRLHYSPHIHSRRIICNDWVSSYGPELQDRI